MGKPTKYFATEVLRNGRRLLIRDLVPTDRVALLAAVGRASDQSLYRRFFGLRRTFSEREIDYFLNPDFVSHVAIIAFYVDSGQTVIVGTGRYFVTQPGMAEVAFAVDDKFQGEGIGTALMRHLLNIAEKSGLREFTAEVLSENSKMLHLFEKCGLPLKTQRDANIIHISLSLVPASD